MPAIPAYR
ncbi:uncharacterized protein FFFS_13185 [Fusarium fujikuroi]|nr:uncharacterized protein FFFS_13185 [Fusarium fujikuroi]